MKRTHNLVLTTALCLLGLTAAAAPLELAGIKVPDSVDAGGTKLQLNGAGIRYKAIFKMSVIALYLGKKAETPEEVYNHKGPKRLTITLLRDVDSAEVGKIFIRGIGDNASKEQRSQLVPGLIKMGNMLSSSKKFLAGENFSIDWTPGVGSSLTIRGKTGDDVVKEPEFFNGVMSIWLGPTPPDWTLKDALLGKT